MQIWMEWLSWVEPLREACSRMHSFLWLVTVLAGNCVRIDHLGVSSIIRALGFVERFYDRLLDFFHSSAVDPHQLSRKWTETVFKRLPGIHRFNGMPVLLGDGIKIPKRGRKMPGVKLMHQVSDSNTKPEYIMGHSIQVVSVLVCAAETFFALPLSGRIHEGLVFSNRDQRTIPMKFLTLAQSLGIGEPFYLVADAYYACQSIALGLLAEACHLVTRLRKNSIAFEPVPEGSHSKRKRGRPRVYGQKIRLFDLFEKPELQWCQADSPVYGEKGVSLRYLCINMIWRPIQMLARFVLVDHPTRGRCIFLCTDLTADPIAIIQLYGLRFKIELSFKQAVRTIGVYAYHFWMMTMDKIGRRTGDQYLHKETDDYRRAVRRKLSAYHRHIQIGLIAQGVLQCLAITKPALVWAKFGSWLCTIRPGMPPSELVVMTALRNSLPEFLVHCGKSSIWGKFLRDRIDMGRSEGLRLAG